MAKAMVKPPPSKPKAQPKARPAPKHLPSEPMEITPAVIKKVGELLGLFGNDKSFTVLEARADLYVVHLAGEYNNRVITIKDGKPEMR